MFYFDAIASSPHRPFQRVMDAWLAIGAELHRQAMVAAARALEFLGSPRIFRDVVTAVSNCSHEQSPLPTIKGLKGNTRRNRRRHSYRSRARRPARRRTDTTYPTSTDVGSRAAVSLATN